MPLFRTVRGPDGTAKLERIDAPKFDDVEMSVEFFRRRPTPHMLLNDPEWPKKYRGPRHRNRCNRPRSRKVRRGKRHPTNFHRVLP